MLDPGFAYGALGRGFPRRPLGKKADMLLRACLGAGALALLLAASGCSDDPEPKVEPTVTSSAPSPSETTSDEPEAWEVQSKAGAAAFADHWVAVFSDAMDGADTHELRSLSTNECVACVALADRLDSIEEKGGFYESSGWQVISHVVDGPRKGRAVLGLNVRQGAERYRETASSRVVRNPTSKAPYSMILVWEAGSWRVIDLRPA